MPSAYVIIRCRSIRRLVAPVAVAHVGSCVCCAARPGAAVSPCGLWCGARDSRPPSGGPLSPLSAVPRVATRPLTGGPRFPGSRVASGPSGAREPRRAASHGLAAGVLGVLVARCLRLIRALDRSTSEVLVFTRARFARGRVGGNRRVLSSKTRDVHGSVRFSVVESAPRAGESSDVAPGAAR